jgi:hypothetical protein
MRSTPGSCGENLRRNAFLHCCKPGFAIPVEPARRMRRAPAFYAPANVFAVNPAEAIWAAFTILGSRVSCTFESNRQTLKYAKQSESV